MSDDAARGLTSLGPQADERLYRISVSEDEFWRLTMSIRSEIPGFSYLEPRRVISDIPRLDGEEARTFDPVLAKCSAALRKATGAPLVYVYIFGDTVPHLHVHLAPHWPGDVCCGEIVHGEHPLAAED